MKAKNPILMAGLLLTALLAGCNKEDINPGGDLSAPVSFTTLIVRQEVPDDVGLINITGDRLSDIRDAIMLEDGSLLAIIGFALYHYNNGEYTLVLDDAPYGVYAIEQMRDGKIVVLGGSDALFTSLDNGATFTRQEKFLASLGQDVALSLYYNGGAGHMLARQLADGSYQLWLYSKYTYNIGGTGFTQDRYMHFVFSSADGTGWTLQHKFLGGATYYPTAIDNNGTVYITEEITDGTTFGVSYAYHTSSDYGNTLIPIGQDAPAGANLISASNEYYTASRIAAEAATSPESGILKWVGASWQPATPVLDDKFRAHFYTNDFVCERAHFTPDNKMLLISNQGILVAGRSF